MKKPHLVAAILLLIGAAVALAFFVFAPRNGAVMVENGAARRLTDEELRRINAQKVLPGDPSRSAPTSTIDPGVRRNMDTINQVQRINQLNKKQDR